MSCGNFFAFCFTGTVSTVTGHSSVCCSYWIGITGCPSIRRGRVGARPGLGHGAISACGGASAVCPVRPASIHLGLIRNIRLSPFIFRLCRIRTWPVALAHRPLQIVAPDVLKIIHRQHDALVVAVHAEAGNEAHGGAAGKFAGDVVHQRGPAVG